MASKLILEVLTKVEGGDKLDSLGGKFQRTGLNLTKFVTAPLVGAGVASLKLAADAEKSGAKLQGVFKSMGAQVRGFTIPALEAQAEALGQATSFDDDEIKEAQATLLTFGNVSKEAFDKSLPSIAGMAELLGTDLQSATVQVGKALNDPIKGLTALGRAGVSFTDKQKEQIKGMVEAGDIAGAQAVIYQELAKEFGGVSDAIAATDAGKAAQAMEDLGNAGEAIGTFLLPVLGNLSRGLSTLATWFQNLDPAVQGFIVTIATVLAAVGPVVFAIGKLIPAIKGVIFVFNLLKVALLTNPFTALAIAVAAIAFLIITNWDKIWAFLKKVWAAITKAVGGLVDFFADAWQGLVDATTAAWNAVVGIIKGVVNGVIDVINGLFGFLNGIQIGIPEVNVGPVHIGGGVIDPFNIPLIPHLAAGGIVDGPTLALIGEKGPEAVVPLGQQGFGETHFHSHIDVRGEDPFIRNGDDLLRTQKRLAFLAGF